MASGSDEMALCHKFVWKRKMPIVVAMLMSWS